MGWYEYFISMANLVKQKSKDPSTQVGVVVVGRDREIISTGFNGFPRGVNDDFEERWERPEKYEWVSHAEENAVLQAARLGISLQGATMVFDFEPFPCARCANAIIQSGIKYLVGVNKKFEGKGNNNSGWGKSCEIAVQKLIEAGVTIIIVDHKTYKLVSYSGSWDEDDMTKIETMEEPNHWRL
jgi:dCMP deaminase